MEGKYNLEFFLNIKLSFKVIRGVAQLASALALGARGPGFESLLPDHSCI